MKTEYQSQAPEAVRKRLLVPKTNLSDDTMSVEFIESDGDIHVKHKVDDDNINMIQAGSNGVFYHVKEAGTWRTVPQAISVGGTGATNRRLAAANLGLEAVNGQTMESYNVPIMGYITENATELVLNFPTHIQTYGINRIVINSLTGVLRGNKGYMDSNNGWRNLLTSPFSAVVAKLHTGLFMVRVTKNTAFTNVDNNTPVCCMINYKFTMYDS